MIGLLKFASLRPFAATVLVALFLCGPWIGACSGQSLLSPLTSADPSSWLERLMGLSFPSGGLGSTFRSEIVTGLDMADLESARIEASRQEELDLRQSMNFDESANRYFINAALRVWRLGLRGSYWSFEMRSRTRNQGKFDFSGGSVGGTIDIFQYRYLTLGAAGDYLLTEPRLEGVVRLKSTDPTGFNLNLKGEPPITAGPYLRFVPPDILGFPVHAEAFLNIPVSSNTRLLNWGGSLVFRPQIYRFDLGFKLGYKKTHLKYQTSPSISVGAHPDQKWVVDMEWDMFSAEVALYF